MERKEKDRLSKETWYKISRDRAAYKQGLEQVARLAMEASNHNCGQKHNCGHDAALVAILEMCAIALGDLEKAA
jgi:hypothetical protein